MMNLAKYFLKERDSRANRLKKYEVLRLGSGRAQIGLGCCDDVALAVEAMLTDWSPESIGEDADWPARLELDEESMELVRGGLDLLSEIWTLPPAPELQSALALDWFTAADEETGKLGTTAIGKLVYRGKEGKKTAREALANQMVAAIRRHPRMNEATCVLSVPGTHHMLSERVGRDVSEQLDITFVAPTWSDPEHHEAAKKGRDSDEIEPCGLPVELEPDEIVVVVDDVWFSGASMRSVAQASRAAGASEVFGLVAVRNIRSWRPHDA